MMTDGPSREVAKAWWLRCVSCSEGSMTTQMRGFGIEEPTYEQAVHAFSGGFMHRGDACGLLTGAVLAAGFEAKRRFGDAGTRSAAALHAAVRLAAGLPELAGSIDCRDFTETELVTIAGRLKYFRTGVAPRCGRVHLKWGERAHRLIDRSLTEFAARGPVRSAANCATETMRRCAPAVGVPEADAVVVAGLAGGVGLLGNVCGALGAGVFALGVQRYGRRREDRRDSRLRGTVQELVGAAYRGAATKLRRAFEAGFGSRLCEEVIGRRFDSPASHAAFIEQGGCREVMASVGDLVSTTSHTA
jgi:hypothetical protein